MTLSITPCDGEYQTTVKVIDLSHTKDVYGLINEAFLVSKCCQHVNILPKISGFHTKDDQLCFVLHDLMKSFTSSSTFKNGLSVEIVAYVIMETLKALECIHVRGGRVHGNLCIKNVFVNEQACVKLAFPTWLINSSEKIYPSNLENIWMHDASLVEKLALDLFYGESLEKKYFGCFPVIMQKKLPKTFEDFIGLSRGGSVTITELMQHRFFNEFCEFDRYKEDLKKLICRTNK